MNSLEYRESKENLPDSWKDHPCFNPQARKESARIHLAVAPRCNVQCKFCDRNFSCVNESRPGVTAKVITPEESLVHLSEQLALNPKIKVVGIAGPGDPFANPQETIRTLRLVHEAHPELLLCVSTNGLNLLPYVNELKRLNVSHVTITVNAVDPQVGAEVYEWTYHDEKMLCGVEAAGRLWENQALAIQALAFRDITVKINTVLIPGVNDHHIAAIARETQLLGASVHNIIPLIPVANTAFASKEKPRPELVRQVREESKKYLHQIEHCARCRADAVGFLGGDCSGTGPKGCGSSPKDEAEAAAIPRFPFDHLGSQNFSLANQNRPYFAVASREGVFVNMHLGEATTLSIFKPGTRKPVFVEKRQTPPAGGGVGRWLALAEILKDCSHLLVNGIGPIPRTILTMNGINPQITSGFIEEAQMLINESSSPISKDFLCGEFCAGTSHGCDQEEKV